MTKSLVSLLLPVILDLQVRAWRRRNVLKGLRAPRGSDEPILSQPVQGNSSIVATALVLDNRNERRLQMGPARTKAFGSKIDFQRIFVPSFEGWRLRSKRGPIIRPVAFVSNVEVIQEFRQWLGEKQVLFSEFGKHREIIQDWNGRPTIVFLYLKVATLPWTSKTVRQEIERLLRLGGSTLGAKILKEIQAIPDENRLILLKDPEFHSLAGHATLIADDYFHSKFSNLGSSWTVVKVLRPDWSTSRTFAGKDIFQKRNLTRSFRRYCVMPKESQVFSGGTVISDGALVDTDYAQSHFFDFVAGRWDHVIGNSYNLNSAVVKVPEAAPDTIPVGILIGSRADFNWFHWVIETVPRLLLVEDLPDNIPILVSDRVSPTGIALLKMITDRQIRRIDTARAQSVETLYIPGQVIFHPDSQEFAAGESSFIADEEVLKAFRSRVLSRLNSGTRPFGRNIFITRRSGARVPFAFGLVESTYRMLGFEVLDMAKLTLEEQLSAVASANRIVLLGGAGMTNLLFCNPKAKVVCFYPKAVGNFNVQERLAQLAGATLITIKGFDISFLFRLPHAKHHVRYFISPIMVARSMLFFRRGH